MTYSFDIQERRRSHRIPQSVPLFVKCPDSLFTFAGNLKSRRGESPRLRDPCTPSLPMRHRTAPGYPSRAPHGHRTRCTLRPDWNRHAPDDMDGRAETRQTRRCLDGGAAVHETGLRLSKQQRDREDRPSGPGRGPDQKSRW